MSTTPTVNNSEVIRDLFVATDAMDTDAKLQFVTDDIRLVFGNADPVDGKDAFRQTSDTFNASLSAVTHDFLELFEGQTASLSRN